MSARANGRLDPVTRMVSLWPRSNSTTCSSRYLSPPRSQCLEAPCPVSCSLVQYELFTPGFQTWIDPTSARAAQTSIVGAWMVSETVNVAMPTRTGPMSRDFESVRGATLFVNRVSLTACRSNPRLRAGFHRYRWDCRCTDSHGGWMVGRGVGCEVKEMPNPRAGVATQMVTEPRDSTVDPGSAVNGRRSEERYGSRI